MLLLACRTFYPGSAVCDLLLLRVALFEIAGVQAGLPPGQAGHDGRVWDTQHRHRGGLHHHHPQWPHRHPALPQAGVMRCDLKAAVFES